MQKKLKIFFVTLKIVLTIKKFKQLAFRWIYENIKNFGGNPNSISVFGESAGASSIVAHLIAPNSRNLFKNGILQSGSLDNKWSMDRPNRAFQKSLELANLVNCNKSMVNFFLNFI